jgi:hypothetical protein
VLTDFPAYGAWNPFVLSVAGEPRAGTRLTVRIQPPGGRAMTFRPTVLVARPPAELRWRGHVLMPGLFGGEHDFILEPLGSNRVRFVHRETFRGLLVPLLRRSLEPRTRAGFEAMNRALKARAEEDPRGSR